MQIGLFIPCYIDQLYPHVGIATVQILEKHGYQVDYPQAQTCCGQPMFNSGATKECKSVAEHFLKTFRDYETVVCPSGSCTSMVRNHYAHVVGGNNDYETLKNRIFELCEFLVDHAKVSQLDVSFPHRVVVHQSCHGLRELETGKPSELMIERESKLHSLLALVDGIELVHPKRLDECCGFGGTFSVLEEALSCAMGNDRIIDYEETGAEYITGADVSCLMHLGGLLSRQKKSIKTLHIAEILAGTVQ